MREIKFRAFDNLKKEMIYKVSVFESCAFKNNIHLPTLNGDRNYFINQFTGLVDKNGTEIYEGDIIRILYTDWVSKPEDDPRTLEQYLTDISNIGEVVFNDNAWEVKIYNKKFDDYSYGSMNFGTHGRIEVIGNIHENPDLLTQHKN